MPGRRSVQPQTQLQVKEFRAVEDIDQEIAKIKRRIAEVQALDARSVRWDDQRVRNVEENIHTTLLEVFGPGSPEYNANGSYRFVSLFAAGNLGDDYRQGDFAKNITQAATMLGNLIGRLQEKRSDFGPDTTARVRNAFEQMELHPRIAAASADLYRDSHYRNAVLDASLFVACEFREREVAPPQPGRGETYEHGILEEQPSTLCQRSG